MRDEPALRSRPRARTWILLAIALVVLRAALLALLSPAHPPLSGDEPHYDGMARSLLEGRGFTYNGETLPLRAPGYSVVLAGLYRSLGDQRQAIVAAQALFDGASAGLMAWVAAWMFGSRLAGGLTFLLILLWPGYMALSLVLYAEPTYTLLLAVLVFCFARFTAQPSWRMAFASGAYGGLAGLVRPSGPAMLAGLMLGWIVFRGRHQRRQLAKLSAMALGAVLLMAPWLARNLMVYGELRPTASFSGELLYLGSVLETKGRWIPDRWHAIRNDFLQSEVARLGRAPTVPELDRAFTHEATEIWKQAPLASLDIELRRLWRLVLVPLDGRDLPWVRLGFLGSLVVLYALAAVAVARAFHARDPAGTFPAILGVTLVFAALSQSVFFTISRYFEPPRLLVIALAAGTLARAWVALRARADQRAPSLPVAAGSDYA